MAKLDLSQKFVRVLKFLLAVTDPRIFNLLALRGFGNETRKEGWRLFNTAGGLEVDLQESAVEFHGAADGVARVDAWENVWFDVADAALRHLMPAVHQKLFHNLGKASGNEAVFTVTTFLDRLDALEADGHAAAAALLATRGLTAAVRTEARALLEEIMAGDVPVAAVAEPQAQAARERAQEQMWQWYLDWSKTARTVVARKDLRIRLGISTTTQHDDEPDEDPATPPAPVPPPAVTPVPVTPPA